MKYSYAYHTRSRFEDGLCAFAPNLARDPVAFDAVLKSPLKFREAISTLHDIVISDLRFKARDKTAYEEWKKGEDQRRSVLASAARSAARENFATKLGISPELEKDYQTQTKKYWKARDVYTAYLHKHDPDLWRMLLPCDPVITVAEDVVFFECFSADESSYGCLTVERDAAFGPASGIQFGTTNVDYSWDLYHQFQSLRSYRETRFTVDPAGFSTKTGDEEYREGKIDLPSGWLRGLMQVQGAMTLPARTVRLGRDAVYSLMAWLKRHKAATSPRALRFELLPDSPALVIEPWETRIPVRMERWVDTPHEPVRLWGRQRLLALARALPLAESIDVHLLGTGLPSFWVVNMGPMKLTLGLSGWTANDWTRGSALDLLAPPVESSPMELRLVSEILREKRAADLEHIARHAMMDEGRAAAALLRLAHTGQVIYDLPHGLYRWRQIMSEAVGESEMGPENEESAAARKLTAAGRVKLESVEDAPRGGKVFTGRVETKPVELLLDADGGIRRGKCLCGHHRMAGLRRGPCRHLLALRTAALQKSGAGVEESASGWYQRLTNSIRR
ncbi:MAG: metal-binding protein [Verrucomicrobiota bacterium]